MAKNKLQLPKINADALKETPQYQQLVKSLNEKPIETYKQLLVLKETSNPLTLAEGGEKLLDNLINSVNVKPEDLDREFQPIELPPEIMQQIQADPEKAYKEAYNIYHYTEGKTKNKLLQRQLYNYTKNLLTEQGKDPAMVLNSNGFIQGLNFVGNLVSVPTNLLAKLTANAYGKSDKVKVWGGAGWEDTFKAINSTPEIQELMRKTNQGIPLTYAEKQKIKSFDDKYAGIGFVFNLVADPTLVVGALGKGLGLIAKGGQLLGKGTKGSEGLYKVGKFLESASSPFKTYKEMKYVRDMDKSGDLAQTVASNIKVGLSELSPWLNKTQQKNLTKLIDVQDFKDFDVQKGLKSLAWLEDTAKTLGKDDIYNRIARSNKLVNDKLFEMNTIKGSKTFKKLADTTTKLKAFLDNKTEKLGLRRAFVSNVPLDAKAEILDKPRRLTSSMINNNAKMYYQIQNKMKKELYPEMKASKAVQNYMTTNKYDIDDVVSNLVEQEGLAEKLGLKKTDSLKQINKMFDDQIILEAKSIGEKALPMLKSADDVKKWKKLANQYKKMSIDNPMSTKLAMIKSEMEDILKSNKSKAVFDPDSLKMMDDNTNYLTHVLSDDAKKIYLQLDKDQRDLFSSAFRAYIRNPSYKSRLNKGSITQLNEYFLKDIGNGQTQFAKDIREGLLKQGATSEVYDPKQAKIIREKFVKELDANKNLTFEEKTKQLKEFNKQQTELRRDALSTPNKEKFADNMQYIAKVLREKNKKFFDTDMKKLIAVRSARSARAIQDSVFHDAVEKFGVESRDTLTDLASGMKGDKANWRKPKVTIPGLMDKYFHPDIAEAIEKMYNYTTDDRAVKKLFNFMKEFQSFWKSTALSFYPSTVFRNMIGNIANSLLAVKNPGKLLLSFKDALLAIKNKDYEILTSAGKRINLQDVYKEASDRGILGTTFKKMDIDEGIPDNETVGGGVVSGITKGLGTAAKAIGQFPTAKANDVAEGMSKLALFIEKVKEGYSFDEAANQTYKVLFDYGDLTDVDRSIKNVVPFWTWVRKNFPLQLANLLSEPSKALIKTEHWMNQSRPSDENVDERFMSEWMQKAVKVRAGKDDKGQPRYIILEGLLPIFDLARIARVYTGGAGALIDDTIKDMSPLVKTPIELATNRSFAFKKDIQKSKYETAQFLGYEISPKLKAVLDDWRPLALLDKGVNVKNLIDGKGVSSTPDKDTARMVLSWMFLNTQPYDKNYAKIVAEKDFKTKMQSELIGYKSYLSKLGKSIYSGNKMSETDLKQIQARGKQLFLMIQDGYSQGKITGKERGAYANQLVKGFLQPAIIPVAKEMARVKSEVK